MCKVGTIDKSHVALAHLSESELLSCYQWPKFMILLSLILTVNFHNIYLLINTIIYL